MKTRSSLVFSGFSPLCLLLVLILTFPGCGPRVKAQPTFEPAVSSLQNLSPGAASVVRLSEAGVDQEVVLAFIESSNAPFALSADDLIYLRDIGIDKDVVSAMIERDTVLASNAPQLAEPQISASTTYTPSVPNAVVSASPDPLYVTNAPVEVGQFYNTLQPYGTWLQLEDLGWCWQPQVVLVDRTWRPYWQGGRWIYSDLGWYWQSDYSWGAAFHYGRWHRHPRCGWVWFPDSVWAPAWVSWRYSDAYCGWAPLPPHARFIVGQGFRFHNLAVGMDFDFGLSFDLFNFVEIGHMHERHPHLHGIPHDRAREAFRHTTVVNNYHTGSDNRIINRGLPPERFAAVTHQELRPVTVRDSREASHPITRPDRIEQAGRERVLYRTEVGVERPSTPVRAQKIDERHPTVAPPAWRGETFTPRPQPTPAAKQPYAFPSTPVRPQSRPLAPAPPQRGAIAPVRPQVTPTIPAPQQPRSAAPPAQPQIQRPPQVTAVPAPIPGPLARPVPQPAAPARIESPRGRDLRLSDSPIMRRTAPPVITPAPAPARVAPAPAPARVAPAPAPAPARVAPTPSTPSRTPARDRRNP